MAESVKRRITLFVIQKRASASYYDSAWDENWIGVCQDFGIKGSDPRYHKYISTTVISCAELKTLLQGSGLGYDEHYFKRFCGEEQARGTLNTETGGKGIQFYVSG